MSTQKPRARTAKPKAPEPAEEDVIVTDPTLNVGQLADQRAAAQGIAGRAFSFKVDGEVARRESPSSVLEAGDNVELVEVTEYQYPENREP